MKSAGRQIMFPISVQMHYIYTQMIKTLHMKKFNLSLIAVLFALYAGTMALDAQPGKRPDGPAHRPGGPDGVELPSPETSVRNTLDRLKPVLNLTEKQYDKLYRLFLKEARMKEQKLRPVPPGPRAGFGADFGGDDAPFPREHMGKPGVPPHGGPGMRPPHENGPADGGGPVGGNGPAGRWTDPAQAEKMHQKMDRKVRKILSDEQYVLWNKEKDKPVPESEKKHGHGPKPAPQRAGVR